MLLGEINRADRFAPEERLDVEAMIRSLRDQGSEAVAYSTNQALGDVLLAREFSAETSTLLVFFSNGSFGGVIGQVAEALGS